MLTSLQIQNFKAWQDTGAIRMAPLTVLFGANSAGKSSLGHLMLALKQTTQSTNRRRALHLGDENSLIDLGTFKDCLFGHNLESPLGFHLQWKLPSPLEIHDPVARQDYLGNQLALGVQLQANSLQQPQVSRINYTLSEDNIEKVKVNFSRSAEGEFSLTSSLYQLLEAAVPPRPLEDAEKFYRISDSSRARFQNAGFFSDLALETENLLDRFYYLGPLREHPRRTYLWSGDTPSDVGARGEWTIPAILAADAQKRQFQISSERESLTFQQLVSSWLKQLGLIHSFALHPIAKGRKEYEVLIKTSAASHEVKITDVGFGVSQILPAIVLPFYCPPHSIVWMEQPEIHLHPQVQADMADIFIHAVQAQEQQKARNVQLVIESHSEHFLNRLQRRIAEEKIRHEDVAIYFCRKNSDGGTDLEALEINAYGDIENWPENFFGDEMEDLTARTIAASQRRNCCSQKP